MPFKGRGRRLLSWLFGNAPVTACVHAVCKQMPESEGSCSFFTLLGLRKRQKLSHTLRVVVLCARMCVFTFPHLESHVPSHSVDNKSK